MAKFISLDNIRTFYTKLKSIFTKNSLIRLDGTFNADSFTCSDGNNTIEVVGVYYHLSWGNIYGKGSDGNYYKMYKNWELYSGGLNNLGNPKPIVNGIYIIDSVLYRGNAYTLTKLGDISQISQISSQIGKIPIATNNDIIEKASTLTANDAGTQYWVKESSKLYVWTGTTWRVI